jgi:phenylpyruvate tautomerase PptA (4-oxalocrotonate tautomerase family)
MPVYRCTVPAGALDDDARKRIAGAITTVHCDVTAAPPTFVHVIYSETDASTYDVSGTIRAGRSDAVKRALVDGLRDAVAAGAGVEAADVTVSTEDIPASWVMEGGELLPEPGDEAAWFARLGRHAGHRDPPQSAVTID